MRLYQGPTQQFIKDINHNIIVDKLKENFENYYGHKVNIGEMNSWNNSLQFVKNLVIEFDLTDDAICVEYELPYTHERIDCLLFGRDNNLQENVVIIELKQWSKVEDCDIDGNVVTFIGGANRMIAHPSLQVEGYHLLLKDFLDVFDVNPKMELQSCVYCHNYSKNENTLFLPKFNDIVQRFPVFTKDDFQTFGNFLKEKLGKGDGLEVLNRFSKSNVRPSKKLLDHTSKMITGQKIFHLIDEQIAANNTILDRAKKFSKLKKKSVIIVKGGPGTGKSVIALNVLAELLSRGQKVFHATGSKSFTTTLQNIVGKRAASQFKYFNNFAQKSVSENELDVLICDEAHRIRKTSNTRFTRRDSRSELPQVNELVRAAKVSIFFIDDKQIVRPDEIGSVALIKETAEKYGSEIFEFELKTQFRCSGSDGYLNWLDNTLQVRETANLFLSKIEKMDFKIFNSPSELYNAINEKNKEKANSARLVAGFCWPWSDPKPDGTLVADVQIGDFKMPWEGRDGKYLAPGIPQWFQWAYDPNGVNQCGCIYTVQGFEFEYIGVIFGNDLIYDTNGKKWVGIKENSEDLTLKRAKENFTEYAKNVYRVLMTRGMKGCYVYFMDKETERFFKSRIMN